MGAIIDSLLRKCDYQNSYKNGVLPLVLLIVQALGYELCWGFFCYFFSELAYNLRFNTQTQFVEIFFAFLAIF